MGKEKKFKKKGSNVEQYERKLKYRINSPRKKNFKNKSQP